MQLALLLAVVALVGAAAVRVRQPVLMAYIAVGILAGPFLGIVRTQHQIELLAQMGITVLLFIVGLKLDLNHLRHFGPVALATGLGQIIFTTITGFLVLLLLGKTSVEAFYIASALTLSSTIIIVKLLSD